MEDRFTYGLNPEKLGAVSSYLCDPNTAPAEFLLVKSQYLAETGRAVSRGALFFQIRQAFLPGEVTAEEANRIGYETAMRWTKGKHQFFVCTHTDKAHIHNHIYFNATAFDRSRKFHNFIGSSFALRRLSDRVCIEHELSVIQNPRQHSKGRFLHYGQWIGEKPPSAKQRVRLAVLAALEKKPTDFADFLRLMEESGFAVKQGRGGVISFLAPGQEKPTRLRASTLGAGFDPEDIKAVIAGERPLASAYRRQSCRRFFVGFYRPGPSARAGHPTSVATRVRAPAWRRNSQSQIPCQRPRSRRPPVTGRVSEAPASVDLKWAGMSSSPSSVWR